MKKAQGMPLNVIIIAILCLVVLVILIWMTTGKIQSFGKGINETTKVEICPSAQIKSIAQCDNPLVGTFVKNAQNEKLGYSEVCCSP
jgi:hypothetical protein